MKHLMGDNVTLKLVEACMELSSTATGEITGQPTKCESMCHCCCCSMSKVISEGPFPWEVLGSLISKVSWEIPGAPKVVVQIPDSHESVMG